MPAIKLLLRRTIATTTVNPPPILSPSATTTTAATHIQTLKLRQRWGIKQRSTLTKGCAGLRLRGAHVKGVALTIKHPISSYNNNNNNNNNNISKRVYMLSSSSTSSSSSSFEERESENNNNNKNNNNCNNYINNKKEEEEEGGLKYTSVVGGDCCFVGEMGNGNKGDDMDWVHQGNGDVSLRRKEDHQKKKEEEDEEGEEKCSKLFTLPTLLTLARVASVPVFIATFYVNSWWGATATTSIFVAAAITDWLDGYLARKMQLGTAFGAFLDPVADKLMVAATLVLLCSRPPEIALFGDVPWLFPVPAIAIIGREITMSAVREWAASQDAKLLQAVAVNNLGKWKTATQMIALTIILAIRDKSISSQGALAASGVGLLYISAGLAAWSLVVYMRKIWKVLMR